MSDQMSFDTPIFGWTKRHDKILMACRASYGVCCCGCAKDGAPNCYQNTLELRCAPARDYALMSDALAAHAANGESAGNGGA